jgi:hypothetical protein
VEAAQRIYVFVPHRSGSMLAHAVTADLARRTGRPHYSENGPVPLAMAKVRADPARELGGAGVYGPLRAAVDVPMSGAARIVMSLRDPRDALVSMFYGYCYSHAGEIEGGTGYRKEVAERGIDDFVIRLATADRFPYRGGYGTGGKAWNVIGNIRVRFERLLALAERHRAHTALLSYADMVADFTGWLRAFAAPFGVTDAATLERLASTHASLAPPPEDVYAHRRHVHPGEHRRKLRPDTIAQLNEVFAGYFTRLARLGSE